MKREVSDQLLRPILLQSYLLGQVFLDSPGSKGKVDMAKDTSSGLTLGQTSGTSALAPGLRGRGETVRHCAL